VDVALPANQQLLRLLAPFDPQCGILLGQPGQAGRDLLLVAASLGEDRQAVHRLRHGDLRRGAVRTQNVPGLRVLELRHARDVTRACLLRVRVLLPLREEQLPHALARVPRRVLDLRVGLQAAGQDLEIADATDERVRGRAEHERRRVAVLGAVGRRRQQIDDRVQQGAGAQLLERGAAHDRAHATGQDALPQPSLDLVLAQRALVEILLEQLVVALGRRLHELLVPLLDEALHVVGDRLFGPLAVGGGHERLPVQEVDDAAEVGLAPDGQVQGDRPWGELRAHRVHSPEVVGVLLVHLVDDHEPRLAGTGQLLPGDLGTDRELVGRAHDEQRTLRRRQPALDLPREVEETRRVEEVELVAVELAVADAEVDRDLAPLLLGLEVERGRAAVGRPQAWDGPRRVQQRFRQRGLAIVGVAQDGDVSNPLQALCRHLQECKSAVERAPRAGEQNPAGVASGGGPGMIQSTSMATVRRSATIEEILTAIEAARDKVMADEVKSLTKLGIPKTMAYQIVASRFRQKTGHEDEPDPFEAAGESWPEIG
jgi:hypothetical protein